jgi:hypothetical protein
MCKITHVWPTCLVGDIFLVVHSNFAFKSNMTTIGFDWNIWLGLVNLEQHMPKWLQMVEQLHVSKQP